MVRNIDALCQREARRGAEPDEAESVQDIVDVLRDIDAKVSASPVSALRLFKGEFQ